ncbi:MAG TPA: hypothetical protein VFA18_12385 [Gemmataceae bacterium]|nr:hypothetical protein [Gemmataceae bacterium]
MLRCLCVGTLVLVSVPVANSLLADDPPPADVLPPPRRVVPAQPMPPLPPPAYIYRRNPYDVWISYGVGRQGFWRPRVVYSPYGPYYMYSGQPFPWTITRPGEFQPYLVAPPEGYGPPTVWPPINGRIPPRN